MNNHFRSLDGRFDGAQDSRRVPEVEAAPLATQLSWRAGLLQLLCAAVDALTPEPAASGDAPGQSADAAAHQPVSSEPRLAQPAKAAANQSASSRQAPVWLAAGAPASGSLLLQATSAFVEAVGSWPALLPSFAGGHLVVPLARAARPVLAAARDHYPPAAAAAWAAMFSRAMAALIAADPGALHTADRTAQHQGDEGAVGLGSPALPAVGTVVARGGYERVDSTSRGGVIGRKEMPRRRCSRRALRVGPLSSDTKELKAP